MANSRQRNQPKSIVRLKILKKLKNIFRFSPSIRYPRNTSDDQISRLELILLALSCDSWRVFVAQCSLSGEACEMAHVGEWHHKLGNLRFFQKTSSSRSENVLAWRLVDSAHHKPKFLAWRDPQSFFQNEKPPKNTLFRHFSYFEPKLFEERN